MNPDRIRDSKTAGALVSQSPDIFIQDGGWTLRQEPELPEVNSGRTGLRESYRMMRSVYSKYLQLLVTCWPISVGLPTKRYNVPVIKNSFSQINQELIYI